MDQYNNTSENVKQAFRDAEQYFPTPIQMFQFFDKYSRFNYDKGRRETWIETVDRSVKYLRELSENKLKETEYERIRKFILEMKATPSMRLLAMAGPAAHRQNACIYNCSYLPIDSIDSFVEALIIAMAGTGVGFSVERKYVDKLPEIKTNINYPKAGWSLTSMIVEDSTEGWADAFKEGLTAWFEGRDIIFNYSKLREAGTPLKIKGGRASGPEPLKNLLDFTRERILLRQGKKLRPIDAHDIVCKVGEAIVSGGVRRTALISLFDIKDEEMVNCKNGDNLIGNEQRWMANNSAVWPEDITEEIIIKQMEDMRDGKRGEPGIFSRANANKLAPKRRQQFGELDYGTNPCGEINLRPYQFCNLSIAIAREDDTLESLKEKVEVATIIGTIQSMATNFPGLRSIWEKNCKEERLLGVDINGWVDCPLLRPDNPELAEVLEQLKSKAVATNYIYSKELDIPQSSAVTCVKPSGNSGVLFNCASGIHGRWAPYYIRNVRVQAESPIRKVLQAQGVPMVPELGQTEDNANTYVVSFPMKSPKGAITRNDLKAVDQCEYWLMAKKHWTEHNPSVTITYKPTEFDALLEWVLDHKEWIGGMSFLPADDAEYDLMPNIEISKQEYEVLSSKFPQIDFSLLYEYEKEDFTTSSTELACSSGVCTIDEYRAKQAAMSMQMI